MKYTRPFCRIFFVAVLMVGLTSCDDNDSMLGEDLVTFTVEVTNVSPINPVLKSGTFSAPGGIDDTPAIFPGESASFTFTAPPSTLTPLGGTGQHLNIATMFFQSNDLFYAFPPEGLDLYDEQGNPVGANGPEDVTDQIFLFDAGTEMDTAPGTGPDQKAAQEPDATDQGPEENENITRVEEAATNDFDYPDKTEVIRVTIVNNGGPEFTVTISNESGFGTIGSFDPVGGSVPLSAGVWAVYENALPFRLFQVGTPASGELELLAEDGFPADANDDDNFDFPIDRGLADAVAEVTGVTTPLSPPVIFSHEEGFQFFQVGAALGPPLGEGIETLAEDGFPASQAPDGSNLPPEPNEALLDLLLMQQDNGVPFAGAAPNPGRLVPALEPALPGEQEGESGSFEFAAIPGDRLNLATMYVQSNDLFYAFPPEGIPLFDENGNPISGDVTGQLALYDAGTEADEEPGVGPNQKARQGFNNLDVGIEENGVVQLIVPPGADGGTGEIGDGRTFIYPANAQIIRVTVTPQTSQSQQ